MSFPSLKPFDVDRHTWFYEEKRGLNVVREVLDSEGKLLNVQTQVFYMPWSKILRSAKRWAAQKNLKARQHLTTRKARRKAK